MDSWPSPTTAAATTPLEPERPRHPWGWLMASILDDIFEPGPWLKPEAIKPANIGMATIQRYISKLSPHLAALGRCREAGGEAAVYICQ